MNSPEYSHLAQVIVNDLVVQGDGQIHPAQCVQAITKALAEQRDRTLQVIAEDLLRKILS